MARAEQPLEQQGRQDLRTIVPCACGDTASLMLERVSISLLRCKRMYEVDLIHGKDSQSVVCLPRKGGKNEVTSFWEQANIEMILLL